MFISVIVPCYNHAPYLKERIESIIHQTYQNFELILLDDLSPDNSAEILLSYKDHPKVTYCIINEKNSGSTFYQWNKGIELAKGELIWIAESDDVADLSFLGQLVKPFLENPNLVLAYSQSYRMDSKGNITGSWKDYTDDLDPQKFEKNFAMSGLDYINQFLIVKNTIPNASAVLFKKRTYLSVNGANPNLKLIGDWAIWFKIVSQGDIFFRAEKLNYFRYHNGSVIASSKINSGIFELCRQVIQFRCEISHFLDQSLSTSSLRKQIIKKNNKLFYKDLNRNCSFAIRRRYYKEIIPTTYEALQHLPIYILPFFIIKIIVKLIYSIILDAPFKKLKNF